MALVKQHSSSDMQTIKKFSNIKYQTNKELSNEYWDIICKQTIFRTYPGRFCEPINHTTKVHRFILTEYK